MADLHGSPIAQHKVRSTSITGQRGKVLLLRSLYNPHIATMEADPTKAYNQDDATGFIRLNGLRLRVNAKVNGPDSLRKPAR